MTVILADKRVSRISTLWDVILKAADGNNSIFSSMYPKIPKQAFEPQIRKLIQLEYIGLSSTPNGDGYLELLPAGVYYLRQATPKEKNSILMGVVELVIKGGIMYLEYKKAVN